MYQILFVCTGNLFRSPLAAAFFSKKLATDGFADSWIVESAGTWTIPGRHIPADFLKAAREFGVELRNHRTRHVHRELLEMQNLIVVMEKGHREALRIEFPELQGRIHLLSELADQLEYDIPDPAQARLEPGEVIGGMSKLIDRAYPRICQLLLFRELH
jgi:protein-tyrosine phosphatase